jgi:hypothetical protein
MNADSISSKECVALPSTRESIRLARVAKERRLLRDADASRRAIGALHGHVHDQRNDDVQDRRDDERAGKTR